MEIGKKGKQPASKRSKKEAGFFGKSLYKSMREAEKQGSRHFLKKKVLDTNFYWGKEDVSLFF